MTLIPVGILSFLLAKQPDPGTYSAPSTIILAQPSEAPRVRAILPYTTTTSLIVPVQGVTPDQLTDTWGAARSEGRVHEGIDIMAALGTPVFAASDGRIVKFFDSIRGGVTVYQFDREERFVYYYAHLNARAPGLTEGAQVQQGQIVGFVGKTGNATTPHLHFEIQRLGPEREWWTAEAMNPYPFLKSGRLPE